MLIDLPPGEAVSAWEDPLALAGLEEGPVTSAGVVVEVKGETWILHVRDTQGAERSAVVQAPHTPAEREEIALLAASLTRPVKAQPEVTKPAPKPPKPAPKPPKPAAPAAPVADVPPPPAPPPPVTVVLAPDQAVPSWEPEVVDLTPEPAPGWVQLGAGADLFRAGSPAPALVLRGGARVDQLRIGGTLSLEGRSNLDLALPGDPRRWGGEAALLLEGGESAWIALEAGAALRRYTQAGELVGSAVAPSLALGVGTRLPVGGLELTPMLRLQTDLREGRVESGDALPTFAVRFAILLGPSTHYRNDDGRTD